VAHKKRRNQDTAAKPITNAITVATNSCGRCAHPSPTGVKRVGSENAPTRKRRGWRAGSLNRAESSRQARGNSLAMVAPDRDTPAPRQALRPADDDCFFPRELFDVPGLLAVVLGGAMTTEKMISGSRSAIRLRAPVRISSLNSRPSTPDPEWCR